MQQVIRDITPGKCDTATQATKLLQESSNINVSAQSIQHLLKANGFKAKHKVKKPYISKKNQKKQLEFAKKHQHWTSDDWKCIIWSDETKLTV